MLNPVAGNWQLVRQTCTDPQGLDSFRTFWVRFTLSLSFFRLSEHPNRQTRSEYTVSPFFYPHCSHSDSGRIHWWRCGSLPDDETTEGSQYIRARIGRRRNRWKKWVSNGGQAKYEGEWDSRFGTNRRRRSVSGVPIIKSCISVLRTECHTV